MRRPLVRADYSTHEKHDSNLQKFHIRKDLFGLENVIQFDKSTVLIHRVETWQEYHCYQIIFEHMGNIAKIIVYAHRNLH